MAEVLTREEFERWVRTKGEDEVVGQSCNAGACPLATFLHEQGYPFARVRDEYYVLDGEHEFSLNNQAVHYPLVEWARHIIRSVDDAPDGWRVAVRKPLVLEALAAIDAGPGDLPVTIDALMAGLDDA